MDDEGNLHSGQKNIKFEVVKHFKNFFKEQGDPSTIDQVSVAAKFSRLITEVVSVAAKFSRLITEVEAEVLYALIQMVELRDILSKFKVDKSPGSDGWTVEFFLHFFDLFEGDILNMVEESRLKGNISGGLNSTFIALVPKVNKPLTFGDYRPISLYNLCYKIISKIIANRTKPILSRSLSEEQLGFLQGRQIQDAIGIVHECLHNIKKKKIKSLVLKLDLQKAYDCINWDLLRMILLQIGLGLKVTNWIMSCVVSTSFAILINGEATYFFKSGRGLRQGCPLSPLLFILVMEGLSLLLKESQREGKLAGINVSRTIKILHILFVDDVIIMTNATLQEWWEIDKILKSFCLASGLLINATKSTFLQAGLSEQELSPYKSLFPYNFTDLATGFKYLGFYLKTGPQRAVDWIWLTKRMEKKIDNWCYRWLSLGGRLTLLKSVLESQSVYWLSLAVIPCSVLNSMRKLMVNFLWKGNNVTQITTIFANGIKFLYQSFMGVGAFEISLISNMPWLRTLFGGF
jgi:hypothetical protein